MLPPFVKRYLSKKYFFKSAYKVTTSRHFTFQKNVLIMSSQKMFRFVNVQHQKHGKEYNRLPFMYWMSNYTLFRARFIIPSSQCRTKPICKVLSKIFKRSFNQISSFHQKCTFCKNHNKFQVFQNYYRLIEKINIICSNKKAKEISTCHIIKIPSQFYINLSNFLLMVDVKSKSYI